MDRTSAPGQRRRVDAVDVLALSAELMGVAVDEFRVHRRNGVLRAVAARMLCKYAGLTQREAADVLQLKSSAAVSKQQHRLSEALKKNRGLRRRVRILGTTLAEMVRP